MKSLFIKIILVLVICTAALIYPVSAEEAVGPDVRFKQAENHFQNRNFEEGIQILLELIEEYPDVAQYHSRIGSIYVYFKNKEKAVYHFDRSIELDPDNPDYYMIRSFGTDNFSQQEAWLLKALEKEPQHDGTVAILKGTYIANAISEEAKCNYDEALNLVGKSIKLIKNYIASFNESSETKSAEVMMALPMIMPQLKKDLANAEMSKLHLEKKIADAVPCGKI